MSTITDYTVYFLNTWSVCIDASVYEKSTQSTFRKAQFRFVDTVQLLQILCFYDTIQRELR